MKRLGLVLALISPAAFGCGVDHSKLSGSQAVSHYFSDIADGIVYQVTRLVNPETVEVTMTYPEPGSTPAAITYIEPVPRQPVAVARQVVTVPRLPAIRR